MRIVYIAKHGQIGTSSDDEGAIAWALRQLGHTVQTVPENMIWQDEQIAYVNSESNLILFHKYRDAEILRRFRTPKILWFFDLVDWPADPTLARRCANRREWFARILPLVDLGFCTDGDWAATNEKLVHLPQGFDTRQAPVAVVEQDYDLLFTGIGRGGGSGREEWLRMVGGLGYKFLHCERGVHGAALANLTARAKITLCPDSPVTDRYWSNRVYNALGFGGFVLHPYCEGIFRQYNNGRYLAFYHGRDDLKTKIDYWLAPARDAERKAIAEAGRKWTVTAHSYLRRCEALLETVKTRLGVG